MLINNKKRLLPLTVPNGLKFASLVMCQKHTKYNILMTFKSQICVLGIGVTIYFPTWDVFGSLPGFKGLNVGIYHIIQYK